MKKAAIFLIVIILIISISGCESLGKEIKEETVEQIVGKILGEDVDVTIVSSAPNDAEATPEVTDGILDGIIQDGSQEDISWPDDIPSNVPKNDLAIIKTIKTPNGIILDYGQMDSASVYEYSALLKDFLYETIREDISDSKIDAVYRKDDTVINLYWYSNGSFSLMITWEQ